MSLAVHRTMTFLFKWLLRQTAGRSNETWAGTSIPTLNFRNILNIQYWQYGSFHYIGPRDPILVIRQVLIPTGPSLQILETRSSIAQTGQQLFIQLRVLPLTRYALVFYFVFSARNWSWSFMNSRPAELPSELQAPAHPHNLALFW